MSAIYEDVFQRFAERQIRYVVVGGIAVTFQGISRTTFDLDIVADMEVENLRSLIATLFEQ